MKILALDTSTEYCSLALWVDGQTRARETLAGQRHSELLFPMLQELLAESGVALDQLDGIAYGKGPGSFTGLRIACGVAQGLAFGSGVPVAGVTTLAALAEACGAERVIACLDARMNEVYHAAYVKVDGAWQSVSEPGLYSPATVPELEGGGWTGCGSGFKAYGDVLRGVYGERLAEIRPDVSPGAAAVARLAAPVFERGEGLDAAEALPLYIRDKVALKTGER